MLFLVLVVIVVVLGFFIIQQLDERRWQRYQFERDMFFRDHPLLLEDLDSFDYMLKLTHAMQRKIITELMLKPTMQPIYKKVRLQRLPETSQEKYHIQVLLNEIKIAELEPNYAQKFGESLIKTDFEIGRPIEVLSEILVIQKNSHELGCQMCLRLPQNPTDIAQLLLVEQKRMQKN
ncbi:hypothetical protein DJ533_03155 [Acinetobacter defluvii]|uniref:Uncharacterized protein n=2 Tax=Acinetobacter defluvii TaxID=1871111 RepID=A0A2S2F9S1_9GAMM|nr:hypothetical protein [Acinetobacter defluvii]AWL27660.1 hypothetical protein DJ533_03155 [Acinetobacter defluvii]